MSRRLTFRKPERKMLAIGMQVRIRRQLGLEAKFEPAHDEELRYSIPLPWLSINGPLSWAEFEIDHRGIGAHIAFDFVPWWPKPELQGMNEHTGKWNHYLWPDGKGDDPHTLSSVFVVAERILHQLRPVPVELLVDPANRAILVASLRHYRVNGRGGDRDQIDKVDAMIERLEPEEGA
jgi:hypothetical protein